MNEAWHAKHALAIGDLEVRLRWHLEHRQLCGCRPMPADLQQEAQRRGLL